MGVAAAWGVRAGPLRSRGAQASGPPRLRQRAPCQPPPSALTASIRCLAPFPLPPPQRRVQRKWEAYLRGAPLRGSAHSPAPELRQDQEHSRRPQGSARSEQQEQPFGGVGGSGGAAGSAKGTALWGGSGEACVAAPIQAPARSVGSTLGPDWHLLRSWPPQQQEQQVVAATSAPASGPGGGSPREVLGGSPKRSHEDTLGALPWGGRDTPQCEAEQWQLQEQGGGKRQRAAGSPQPAGCPRLIAGGGTQAALAQPAEGPQENGAAEHSERALRGASPTALLSAQLQATLGAGGGKGSSGGPVATEAGLSAALAAALQCCVAAGELPTASYPQAQVQAPTPRARKQLPPSVCFTSPLPLAAAAAASRMLEATGSAAAGAAAAPPSTQRVAAALLARLQLPEGVCAEALRGHLNFSLEGSAAPGAPGGSPGGASGRQLPPLQREQQEQQQRSGAPAAGRAQVPAPIPRGPARHFEVRMLPATDPGLVRVEFDLFRKYQVGRQRCSSAAAQHMRRSAARWAGACPMGELGCTCPPTQRPPAHPRTRRWCTTATTPPT